MTFTKQYKQSRQYIIAQLRPSNNLSLSMQIFKISQLILIQTLQNIIINSITKTYIQILKTQAIISNIISCLCVQLGIFLYILYIFSKMQTLQKTGYRYFLKSQKMSELKSEFYRITCSRYGDQQTLTKTELLHFLIKQGLDVNLTSLSYFDRELFKEQNKNYYTCNDAIKMVDRLSISPQIEKEYKKIFKIFDVNGNNKLTALDLRRTINSCHGKSLDCQQIEEIFNDMDIDKDGLVSYEDFLCAMISK